MVFGSDRLLMRAIGLLLQSSFTSTVTVTDFLVGDRPHGFMQQNSTAGLGKRAGLLTVNDIARCAHVDSAS